MEEKIGEMVASRIYPEQIVVKGIGYLPQGTVYTSMERGETGRDIPQISYVTIFNYQAVIVHPQKRIIQAVKIADEGSYHDSTYGQYIPAVDSNHGQLATPHMR